MRIEMLNDRIQKAEEKIEKKRKTIQKKSAWIEKKQSKLSTLSGNEKYWAECDIGYWKKDIERLESEIQEIETSLETYRKMLSSESEKEAVLEKEIPEFVNRMQNELVECWDDWDIKRRDKLKEDYRSLGYEGFIKKYRTRADYDFMYLTDAQIHKRNENDARNLIIDLYNRVKRITGEITDWSGLHANAGAQGVTVLNGVIIGKEGRCEVESILAGGYNIQRLHIRVLTKEIN